MFMYGFYFHWTYWLVIVGIIITAVAQGKMSSTYSKYSRVRSRRNLSAYDAARQILDYNGLEDVRIEQVRGSLTDHYDPRSKVLRLSQSTFNSNSVAALGVAAHEAGHAIQDQVGYGPLRLRSTLVPVANFGSQMAWIFILLGFIMDSLGLIDIGILLFSLAVVFQLVTLPVEYDASSRALAALEGGAILDADEIPGTRKVLNAAALTYVAATLTAILQLLRLILLRNSRR